MEKISWTDHVRKDNVLHGVKEERNMLHTVKRREANCIGYVLHRNCHLTHFVEGNVEGRLEMTGSRERRRKQLLGDLRERRGCWKLKEGVLIALSGELAVEETMDLSSERLRNG
jgi:hypothetical protein